MTVEKYLKLFVRLLIDSVSSMLSLSFPKTYSGLLIIKSDGIGDYFLFRPFLPLLKKYARQYDWKVTLLVQEPVYSFSLKNDSDCVDNWQVFDHSKYTKSISYRFSFNLLIRKHQYHTVFLPISSRNINSQDSLIRNCISKEKIGVKNDNYNSYLARVSKVSDKWFTRLIDPEIRFDDFEYLRNRKIIASFTGFIVEDVLKDENRSFPGTDSSRLNQESDFVIFHGASTASKRWNPENWVRLFQTIPTSKLVLCGGTQEISQGRFLSDALSALGHSVVDKTGKTSLEDMCKELKSTKLLLTNETMAVHLSFLCRKPAVVISNGNHFLRFHPYPNDLAADIRFVYPEKFAEKEPEIRQIIEKTGIYEAGFDINEIKPDSVLNQITNLLSGCYE